MTQLPVPNMNLLMDAYGKLGASQGRAKQRQQDFDNSIDVEDRLFRRQAEDRRAALEAERLRQQQERQRRDTALSLARLYSDDAYRRSQGNRVQEQYGLMAQRDASNVLNEQVNERLQFGAQANLSEEARAAHNRQLGQLQAIMKARSRSTRPWQYDDALTNWVREYDALNIPAQVRPDAQPQMVPIQGPDGEVWAMGMVDPSTGQVTRTIPKPKAEKPQAEWKPPTTPQEAFFDYSTPEAAERSDGMREKYRDMAVKAINMETAADKSPDLSEANIRKRMLQIWEEERKFQDELRKRYEGGATPTTAPPPGPTAPQPLPPDPSQLQPGAIYQSPDGRLGRWNGQGFDPV